VAAVVALLAAGLVMYATNVLAQELAFRGYFYQNLAERLPTRTAAIVAGLIFAVLHLPGDEFSPLLALVVVADHHPDGVLLTLTRLATGSLWLAIGFHTAWNWTMDYGLSLDTVAGPDYGNALVHTRVGGPDLLGPHGGVELLYALTSGLLPAGYWLLIRRRRAVSRAGVPAA
jgi:membrane protease YdiL (CAAX protease family)